MPNWDRTGTPDFSRVSDLLEQGLGRQDHPVADQATDARPQDPGGHQVQDSLDPVDDQGVTRVVAPLKSHHGGDPVSEQIDDLALALVTPLGANDDYVVAHLRDYLR